ncbi:MAG: nucleotide exchange factor GrpE [Actinomycetota bacterium]|nr:nucleotide exchange factor GrpE [Actinomycetota bacterium]
MDPETGELREPQAGAAPGAGPQTGDARPDQHRDPAQDPDVQAMTGEHAASDQQTDRVAELEASLSERTLDLQRLQAEYVNYKRRVDRDRELVREAATANVLTALLPVLDDIDRARDHGELEGGFKAVADAFGRTIAGLGLERFGEVGETFDPRIHEALMHQHADDIDGPTCTAILQPGYRIGERVIRPARVAVAEPSTDPAGAPVESAADDGRPADADAPAEDTTADRGEATGGAGGTGEAAPDERG